MNRRPARWGKLKSRSESFRVRPMFGFKNSHERSVLNPRRTEDPTWSISRWAAASYLCVGLTLLGLLGLEIWGARHDLELVHDTFLESEMGRLRSHAMRTVHRVQDELREMGEP